MSHVNKTQSLSEGRKFNLIIRNIPGNKISFISHFQHRDWIVSHNTLCIQRAPEKYKYKSEISRIMTGSGSHTII